MQVGLRLFYLNSIFGSKGQNKNESFKIKDNKWSQTSKDKILAKKFHWGG